MDKPLADAPPQHRPPARRPRDDRAAAKRPVSETRANVRAVGIAMLIALALMALFNSSGLKRWTRDLPDGWLADALVVRADRWHELMLALGPAHVEPAVRELFGGFRSRQW